jgi:hypothetical protein
MKTKDLQASDKHREMLKELKDEEIISEMNDGYRFAIALALAYGEVAPSVSQPRQTVYAAAKLDPDGTIATLIECLYDRPYEDAYEVAERLAEWGLNKIHETRAAGEIDFAVLIQEASARRTLDSE